MARAGPAASLLTLISSHTRLRRPENAETNRTKSMQLENERALIDKCDMLAVYFLRLARVEWFSDRL